MEKLQEFGIGLQKFVPNFILKKLTKTLCSKAGKSTSLANKLRFIKTYKVDWKRATLCRNSANSEICAGNFKTLDDFFQRHIPASETKPKSNKPNAIVSPAECFVRRVSSKDTFSIKKADYNLSTLIDKKASTVVSPGASIYIFRLAPEHYHRIHAPFDSEIVNIKTVQGSYRSVNPIVLNSKPVLQENFRKIMELKNGMFFIAIGATCVGSIILNVKKGSKIVKGQDLGTFGFGGSCLVLVIPNELGKIKEKLKITTEEQHIQPGTILGFIE